MKLKTSGLVITKREIRKTGKGKAVLDSAPSGLRTEEHTDAIGPFSVSPSAARVSGEVRVTLSENYHSVNIGITVQIPTEPNEKAVQAGLDYCFDTAHNYMNEELKQARTALTSLARG